MRIPDEAAMEGFGRRLARAGRPHGVVFVRGPLGAGKTTFVRGALRGLGATGPIKSPTYTLVEPYCLQGIRVYHFDLYRVEDPLELEEMGAREYFEPGTLAFVEWPEHAGELLPPPDLEVVIAVIARGREVELRPRSGTGRRLAAAARRT